MRGSIGSPQTAVRRLTALPVSLASRDAKQVTIFRENFVKAGRSGPAAGPAGRHAPPRARSPGPEVLKQCPRCGRARALQVSTPGRCPLPSRARTLQTSAGWKSRFHLKLWF